MAGDQRARALQAFERATALPMLVLSLVLLTLLALPLLTDLSSTGAALISVLVGLIWAVFAVQLAVRVYLAPRRGRYLLTHWYDAVIVLLPALRPFRILLIIAVSRRTLASWLAVLTRHGLQYALLAAVGLLVTSALAVWYFEHTGDGDIQSFGTALWWAVQTTTSVGYGDAVPVTVPGRVVAVLAMLVGIGLFSVVTANVAAFLVEGSVRTRPAATLDDVAAEVRRLERQIAALQEQVQRLTTAMITPGMAGAEETRPQSPPAPQAGQAPHADTHDARG